MATQKQMKRQNAWVTKNMRKISLLIHKENEQENRLFERLETYCAETGKSRNSCILSAIQEFLEKRGK